MLRALAVERSRWSLAFAISVTLLVILAAIMLRNTFKLRDRERRVTHSNEVIQELETMTGWCSRLLIKTRQQLTHDSADLHSQSSDKLALLTESAAKIESLVADNVDQTEIGKQLRMQAEKLQQALSSLQSTKADTVAEINAALEPSDVLLSKILDSVALMRGNEEKLLQVRTRDSLKIFWSSLASQLGATLFAIAAAFSSLYLAQQRYREQVKMVEDKMRQDEKYQFLMNSTSEGLCGVELDGTCSLINKAGADMLGYHVDELLGKNFHAQVHSLRSDGTNYPHLECPIHVAITTAKGCNVDNEVFWHRLGHPISVEYAASPWMQHGIASGAVVSFRDISVRKDAEQRILKAQSEAEESRRIAEAASHAKSNFLANMSHELRTPLNAVIMYSEMLQEEAADMHADHFAKDLARIHTAGRHLLALVNGVLDIAKIEAGKMDLHLETVPIQSTIADVVDTIRSLVDKNKNRLDVQVGVDGTMRQDVTKFRQILFNLLSNAAKFTNEGVITLKVAASMVTRGTGSEREWLVIDVVDTGLGISAEKLDDLFKPFVQAEKSTSKEYGGTGLGLTITKQFAELMGGTVQVSSELGTGTTFSVHIPRYRDEKAISKLEPDEAELKRPDVLIIDDDPDSCDFVSRALASDGISTLTAHDGESGLRLAQDRQPSLIVLDVLMPKMDGWNVLSRLKANSATTEIPVVLLTIVRQSELGFSLGAAEYLGKPVTREQLISVAHRLGLSGERSAALVVDDDPATREVLERMLSREGWSVQTAADGRIAMTMLESGSSQPDMILLDLQMPNMDGFDFIASLRHGSLTTTAPVVVLTSRDLTVEERKWLDDRVERILQKGGQTQVSLLKTLREVIRNMADSNSVINTADSSER